MSDLLARSCLLVDGLLLQSSLDVVEPELVSALDPPPWRQVDGLIGRRGSGRTIAARLDAAGITASFAHAELAIALELVVAAHAGLAERTKRLLGWPAGAGRLTADRWLVAYAARPTGWLLDMAGGLMPACLLRCCLLARPDSLVELWLDPDRYGPPRFHGAEPEPAPVPFESARTLLRRPDAGPVKQLRRQP